MGKDVDTRGAILFNKLPVALKNLVNTSKSHFKYKLKEYLINKCLYNLEEL